MNTCVYRKHSSGSWLTSDTLSDDADLRADNYTFYRNDHNDCNSRGGGVEFLHRSFALQCAPCSITK